MLRRNSFALVAATLRPLQIINDQGAFVDSATSQTYLEQFAPRGLKYGVVSSRRPSELRQVDAAQHALRHVLRSDGRRGGPQPNVDWYLRSMRTVAARHRVARRAGHRQPRGGGDAGRRFDRQAALFALALSDVLCVNLWENDIGRAQASNLDLLRPVLEVNLEPRAAPTNATAAPPRTTLLFVVRDHVPGHGGTPLEVLESQLKAQLNEVWAAVSKPADCELALGDLFEVQVVALPHLLAAEGFVARRRRDARRALWLPPATWRRTVRPCCRRWRARRRRWPLVPSDALDELARRCWARISENTALDLPSEHALLAAHRCEALKDDALKRCESKLRKLRPRLLPSGGAPAAASRFRRDAGGLPRGPPSL